MIVGYAGVSESPLQSNAQLRTQLDCVKFSGHLVDDFC